MYNEMQAELDDRDEGEKTVEQKQIKPIPVNTALSSELCPECGEAVMFEGGCKICKSCGWTKCE